MATKHMQLQIMTSLRCFMLRIMRHCRMSQPQHSKRCCGPKSYNHINWIVMLGKSVVNH